MPMFGNITIGRIAIVEQRWKGVHIRPKERFSGLESGFHWVQRAACNCLPVTSYRDVRTKLTLTQNKVAADNRCSMGCRVPWPSWRSLDIGCSCKFLHSVTLQEGMRFAAPKCNSVS
ncbi:unnamed protein product [Nezara viridula]|uniref:Uncharacterized protein n=1 Tax=Nezara viridula TaxID=85310 RepID=A0A9P0E0G0_NEZVI|nr:unnamed protein product [Nezara viridula]